MKALSEEIYGKFVIVDPLAEERTAIYQRNLCIDDSTGLYIVIRFAVVAS